MKKGIKSLLLAAFVFVCMSFTAFAATPKISYESSFDSDTGLVSVTVYIENAEGVESGDISLAFDKTKLEFVESKSFNIGNGFVAQGLSIMEDDVCNIAFAYETACTKENLDENGKLAVSLFEFKPITGDYGDDDFCLWATSMAINNKDIAENINSEGNKELGENRPGAVQVKDGKASTKSSDNGAVKTSDAENGSSSSSISKVKSNWYIYVIAAVLAVALIVGIALVAIKGGQKTDEKNESDDSSETKSDE